MLIQRIVTAILLLAILIPAMLATSAAPFASIVLLLIGAAGWEWARLSGARSWHPIAFGALVFLACAAAWWAGWVGQAPKVIWWMATAFWVLGGAVLLRMGVTGWARWPVAYKLVLGAIVLFLAWLALAVARERGVVFTLSVFCVVWVADVAAYAGGKLFGRRKLAPAISPGKSWEGVISGMVAVILLGLVWVALESDGVAPASSIALSLFSLVDQRLGSACLVAVLVYLSAMSVVGDLTESLIKRAAGAKDSSGLLPGHGGVLDRVDALLPVFPLSLALAGL
jgi:phosphatidate cytidylyltransferase